MILNNKGSMINMKIGRNDPCPCGSGKKYKKCCGRNNDVINLNEVQLEKEKPAFFQKFFSYIFENWQDDLMTEYLNIKSIPETSMEEALEDDDFIILVESFSLHNKVKNGKTPLELFLKYEADNFRSITVNYFQECLKIYFSLYKVLKVTFDHFRVKDIFLNTIHDVTREEFQDDIKEGDVLFTQLTNSDNRQSIFFNYINLKNSAAPFIDAIYRLHLEHKTDDFKKLLKNNSYSITKSILTIANQLDSYEGLLLYSSLHIFAINWLISPLKAFNDLTPLETFQTSQGRRKVLDYLKNLDDPDLSYEERDLIILSKGIIREHLGLLPGIIVDVKQYEWDTPTYREIATKITEDFSGMFTPYQISKAIQMWFDYSSIKKPRIVKYNTWIAVIKRALLEIEFNHRPNQKKLAQSYSISSTTLINNYNKLKQTLNLEDYKTFNSPISWFDDLEKIDQADTADMLIDEAYNSEDSDEKIALAKKALKTDPDNIDAYLILGEESNFWDEALEYYYLAVQAAEKILGKSYFEKNKGSFWGLVETRPYMIAKSRLAQALWELDRKHEAIEHMIELIQLNPNDNQGIRYVLSSYLLYLDEDEKFEKLCRQFPNDSGIYFRYNRALFLFKKHGDCKESIKALKDAIKYNKYVPKYLIREDALPDEIPYYYSLNSPEEAIVYAIDSQAAWQKIPGAIKWLQKHL